MCPQLQNLIPNINQKKISSNFESNSFSFVFLWTPVVYSKQNHGGNYSRFQKVCAMCSCQRCCHELMNLGVCNKFVTTTLTGRSNVPYKKNSNTKKKSQSCLQSCPKSQLCLQTICAQHGTARCAATCRLDECMRFVEQVVHQFSGVGSASGEWNRRLYECMRFVEQVAH